MVRKILLTTTVLSLSLVAQAQAQETAAERLVRLEQEINLLKRQQEVNAEVAEAAASKTANVEIGKKGFAVTSKDGKYALRIRGYAQFDNRSFISDNNDSDTNDFLIRRARPIIESQAGDFSFRFMPDFAGSATTIFDAHADYKVNNALAVRVGKFKPPVDLDRLKSANDITFVERSMPTNLAPNRDVGVMAYGNLVPEVEYQLGVFNGTVDLGNDSNDKDDAKDLAARVFLQPFVQDQDSALKGLGFGIGGTYGSHDGDTTNRQLGEYRTPGQAKFFSYRSSTFADGTQWRAAPQAYYYYGLVGVLAEYAISSQELRNGSNTETVENKAWETQLSYVLTGEDATYKSISPYSPFDPENGQYGAWEVATKYGELEVDDAAYPIFADVNASAEKAKNWGVVLNGYLNDNVKVSLDYEHTTFDGGASAGADREKEQVVLSRVGYKF